MLGPGDQLPTVRDVVKQIAINPNTVHRAYRELETQGLTEGRPGSGTFVRRSLSKVPEEQPQLQRQLEKWMRAARAAGLGDEAIAALVAEATESSKKEEES
jgi:GntR family transcriptional regulator